MPLTFIDIERQKNWRIAVFFGILVLIYLAVVAVLGATFAPFLLATPSALWTRLFPLAVLIAAIHFWFSASDAVNDVVRNLDARPPDADDRVHRTLANIMEELHVVTGNRRTIRCAVIPSLSLNALAAEDLKGNALIAVTEGLLSRLTRPQLETVIAHETHHILSGDCLASTVAASLFGTLSAAVEKFRASRGYVAVGLLFAWLLLQLGNLLNLFISREREYRADAAAVRMSRNPLALAEVLFLLSRSWRGAGFIGSGFEMLCIVNPVATILDESEGFLADLLSTHPPLRKRIDILLGMARVPVGDLEARATSSGKLPSEASAFHAMNPQHAWEGPFTLGELSGLPWLGPLTWISSAQGASADRAWKNPLINALFLSRLSGPERNAESGFSCPACGQQLLTADNEGSPTFRCAFCAGTLVRTGHIPRILARTARGNPCTERINALALALLKQRSSERLLRVHSGAASAAAPKLACPKCKNPMSRGFYSLTYLVEVDRCSFCGLTWFDRDELEMLQCMIENRLVADADGPQTTMTPRAGESPETSL
jgi:heat shock protein HtpX